VIPPGFRSVRRSAGFLRAHRNVLGTSGEGTGVRLGRDGLWAVAVAPSSLEAAMDQKRNLSRGASLAGTVATLLLAGCGMDSKDDDTSSQEAQLTCLGANECAGKSECAGGPGDNSCAGMNECKGMGWIYVESEKACTDEGGTIKTEES
jgi:uncharacterized membrane protein